MIQLVESDAPFWRLPPLGRALVLMFTIITFAALNANLAYLMTASTPTSAGQATVLAESPQPSVDEGEVVALCDLAVVVCSHEQPNSRIIVPLRQGRLEGAPIKKGASDSMQEMVDYAWQISKSWDFVLTIEAESGFNPKARNVNRNGTVDSGLAQINHYYHPQIVKDPRFADWKWQLEQGWRMYKGGTKFYGYDVRHKVKNRFVMR